MTAWNSRRPRFRATNGVSPLFVTVAWHPARVATFAKSSGVTLV